MLVYQRAVIEGWGEETIWCVYMYMHMCTTLYIYICTFKNTEQINRNNRFNSCFWGWTWTKIRYMMCYCTYYILILLPLLLYVYIQTYTHYQPLTMSLRCLFGWRWCWFPECPVMQKCCLRFKILRILWSNVSKFHQISIFVEKTHHVIGNHIYIYIYIMCLWLQSWYTMIYTYFIYIN